MVRYRHIIWDWNGTLLDDLELTREIVNGMLRRQGLPEMDRARYHAVFDFPVRNYYAAIGFDPSEESFRSRSAEFIDEYDRRRFETTLHAGAREVLAAVVAAGMTQSILSAYRHETLCEIVGHFGLTEHFTGLAGLDNIYAESKAELGRRRLAELQVAPRDVVMIGDTLHDYDVAEAMGVACILVAHGHHPLDRLIQKSEHVVNDLGEAAQKLGVGL